jgi:protein gp37
MADGSEIEWTDATWNPITGCKLVSAGCTFCYAMLLAGTRLKNHPSRKGLTLQTKAGPVWNGKVRFNEEWLTQPLSWKRPRRIFVCAHGDLFAEEVPDAWIDRVFAVMALAPQHTFQVLTKRAARMRAYHADKGAYQRILNAARPLRDHWPHFGSVPISDPRDGAFWPHVWKGVSCEDQLRANERIPELLQTPAGLHFVSLEPLLGPIELEHIPLTKPDERSVFRTINALTGRRGHGGKCGYTETCDPIQPHLGWVITGGESGLHARPMHPDWERKIRDDCAAAGVPYFKKQWGEWLPWSQFSSISDLDDSAEQTRFDTCEWTGQGWRDVGRPMWSDSIDGNINDDHCVGRVGKKIAGRTLDGIIHDAMPQVSSC